MFEMKGKGQTRIINKRKACIGGFFGRGMSENW